MNFSTEPLVPDQLKSLWQQVEQKQITREGFAGRQHHLIEEYKHIWKTSLCLDTQEDLESSILLELSLFFGGKDLKEIRKQCAQAVEDLKHEWLANVVVNKRGSVEQYYQRNQQTIYELMWWHSLCEDNSPLAYVAALHMAKKQECRRYLDFGAGVGSGGILFAGHGLEVTLADISVPLQEFSAWRLRKRKIGAQLIDLNTQSLPTKAFDFVTAMDVFEHLVDPVETMKNLSDAIKPGGIFFARLASEIDEDRPQHIIQDFGPTFECLKHLGFVQVWEDDWLWGHLAFQKA